MVLFHPKGSIGSSDEMLIIVPAVLMLLVIIPVIIMAIVFARRYRASNKKAKYAPEWEHSKRIEAVVWAVPALIVAVLSVLAWIYSHNLDPYRALKSNAKPVTIEVVSLDWKWLFIYPDQHIATVNKIEFPTNVPVHFYITSETVMNSFFIPQLGSQIMSMPGMQTQLNLMANHPGTYHGISANFSGRGFSGMTFKAVATKTVGDFKSWVQKVKQSPRKLDHAAYEALKKPSENNAVTYYSSVEPKLFHGIIAKYMANAPLKAASTGAGS